MEHEWQTSVDLEAMLEQLREASPRKLRVFAVACCQKIRHLVPAGYAEGFVEAIVLWTEVVSSEPELLRLRRRIPRHNPDDASDAFTNLTSASAWGAAAATAYSAARASAWAKTDTNVDAAIRAETAAQCDLLREIFGNPYRALPPRPEAIMPLAEQIYAGKWDLMPLLGEWLQEHSFWQIGEHCLDPTVAHVKGCWVVDWVLGKE